MAVSYQARWNTLYLRLPDPLQRYYRPQIRNYAANPLARQLPKVRTPPQKSIQVGIQQQAGTTMPNDLGLLPGTFIMPAGANKPSIFRSPRLRWRLECHRIKARLQDFRGVLTYKFAAKGRPFPKLGRRKIVPTATALHKQMYTALVEKDTHTLSSICTDGLLASLMARIVSRPPKERQQWTLHKYTHTPRIVSDRATMFQMKGAALRQVVVRIRSIQSLVRTMEDERPSKKDALINGSGEEKQMDEYLVVQRRIWKGQEEPWMIWGTSQASKVGDVLAGD